LTGVFSKKSQKNHLDIFHKIMVFLSMFKGMTQNSKKTPRQTPTQKMPKAFFVRDPGNRQQATGNRQQATGNRQQANYTHRLNNRVNYPIAYIFPSTGANRSLCKAAVRSIYNSLNTKGVPQ